MKELACSICRKVHEVDDEVTKVTCGDCVLTGGAPTRVENGTVYYTPEAFLKLVSAGIDTWTVDGDKEAEEKKLIKRFNRIRKKEDSLVRIRRKLGISWPKTQRLEGYRLLEEGSKRKDIAKELEINLSTVSRWKVLQKKLNAAPLGDRSETLQRSYSQNGSGGLSSRTENDKNPKQRKTKINYHFSAESLRIAFGKFRNDDTRQKRT